MQGGGGGGGGGGSGGAATPASLASLVTPPPATTPPGAAGRGGESRGWTTLASAQQAVWGARQEAGEIKGAGPVGGASREEGGEG